MDHWHNGSVQAAEDHAVKTMRDHAVIAEGNPWPWGKTTTVVTGKDIQPVAEGQDNTRCRGD